MDRSSVAEFLWFMVYNITVYTTSYLNILLAATFTWCS